MTKWITLTQAAAKYDTDARNIKNWGQKGVITVARIGETWMVDDNSITSYLESAKTVGRLKEELISLKEEYAAQIADCIKTNDERLFLLNKQKEIVPLLRLVIYELANVIKEKESRYIFTSISTGKPVLAVAEEIRITYDKVAHIWTGMGKLFILTFHVLITSVWRRNGEQSIRQKPVKSKKQVSLEFFNRGGVMLSMNKDFSKRYYSMAAYRLYYCPAG